VTCVWRCARSMTRRWPSASSCRCGCKHDYALLEQCCRRCFLTCMLTCLYVDSATHDWLVSDIRNNNAA
jgi:hypothetical protein